MSPHLRRLMPKRRTILVHPPISKPVAFLLALALIFILVPPFVPTPAPPTLLTLPEERVPHTCPTISAVPPVYIFLHLHKTSGNALKTALFSFAKRNALALHHTCHPAELDPPLLAWYLSRNKSPTGLDCNLRQLPSLSLRARDQLLFVIGHQHFGAHTMLPHRPARYFTFLRHPLRRKISHFRHFEPRNASLAEYLVVSNRNYMTKRLSTSTEPSDLMAHFRARLLDTNPFAARAAAAAAKTHLLSHFFFLGLYERHSQSVCILSAILNRACGTSGPLAMNRQFNSKNIPPRIDTTDETDKLLSELSPDVRRAAETAEAADMEIYRFAQALFVRKLALYPECNSQ